MSEELGKLKTLLGDKSVYDAVSQCSRCGYCLQSCPTYVATGREDFSPRGRNQLVRMVLEGKLVDAAAAEEAWATCLLCGACSTACYAHVPTAELVLEGRRRLRGPARPLARLLGSLLRDRPRWLALLMKAANIGHRLGLPRLIGRLGLWRLLGLQALGLAAEHVEEAPLTFLAERLRDDDDLADPRGARWLYFAPCGPNYLFPRVGLATTSLLKRALGRGAFLDNPCCGLLFYNYGELSDARTMARRVVERHEAFRAAGASGPLVGDCSSCVGHMKNYPQLFLDDGAWKERAERFSASVKDVAELAPALARGIGGSERVTYHDSCRARHGQGVFEGPREALRASCGDSYVELPEADGCCGGAGMYAFTQMELSDEVLRRKADRIASTRASVVATSSTSCLVQLAHGLKKYYPDCTVVHLAELLAGKA